MSYIHKPTVLVICAILLGFCSSFTTNVQHPSVKLKTGMVYMKSSTDKLFGVDISGNLQERIYSGSSWQWVSHGNGGEKLVSTPCILQDGNIFVISEKGNLFERHWWAGSWGWKNHHSHPNSKIRPTGCTCTNTNGLGRVFVVGLDLKLYERFWNNNLSPSNWAWASHSTPNPSIKIGFNIDSCNLPGCSTEVYVAGTDGNVWKRRLSGSSFHWQSLGRPIQANLHNEFVHSVNVGNSNNNILLFAGTKTDQICRYWGFNHFSCYGKPPGNGFTSQPHIEMSKPVYVGDSCTSLANGWYIILNSWDPVRHRRGKMFSYRLTAFYHYVLEENVSASYAKIDAPLVIKSGRCPKIFSVNSNGAVWERL